MKKYLFITLFLSIQQIVFSQTQQQYTIQPSSVTGMEATIFNRPDFINSTVVGTKYLLAASWTWSGTDGTYRSLIRFDLSNVPTNVVFDSVKLFLTVDSTYTLNPGVGYGHNSFTQSNKATLKKVTSTWTNGTVTWNNQPTTSSTDSIFVNQSSSDFQNYSLNVTTIVNQWLSNPSTNYGFLLKTLIETKYNVLVFCSSKHPKPANRPKLTFYYKTIATDLDQSSHTNSGIKLYPVPATDQFTIEINESDLLNYQLYSPQGALALSGEILNHKVDVNVSSLTPGIYLLHLTNLNGDLVKVKKMVK